MKHILVRYGELTLKGKNKNIFVNKLIQNIKFKLKKYKEYITYYKDFNSLTLNINDENKVEDISRILVKIFGIYSISLVHIVKKELDLIKETCLEIAKQLPKSTFKLEVERKDKTFPTSSVDLKFEIAKYVLQNTDQLTVDVKKPETRIDVVIKKDGAYIYSSKINASKGLPVGISGKAISLLSGGIDSPVSSYLTLKRGMQVDFLHFMTPPHTSKEALDKVFSLAKLVSDYNVSNFTLYVCDFSKILQELMHMSDSSYRITLMRRAFMVIANLLCEEIGAKAIITGESLGQVASQTIDSINVINTVSALPILRPLLTYDKEEIIDISKKINTYETSILPFDDVCSMYVPDNPVTKPIISKAEKLEEELLLDELISYTMKKNIKAYYLKDGEWFEKANKSEEN